MTAPVSIQTLAPGDAAALRAMLHLFAEVFGEPETYAHRQPDDAYLERLLASDSFVAITAMEEGKVVGGLAGYVLHKFEQDRREFYIYDLGVADSHRRQGIATKMIGQLQQLAVQRGFYVIFVQADHGDDPAVALYTKLGTREDVMHFDIPPAA